MIAEPYRSSENMVWYMQAGRLRAEIGYLAATAVALQWLDWMPPTVTMLSLLLSIASLMRNSSFLTYGLRMSDNCGL